MAGFSDLLSKNRVWEGKMRNLVDTTLAKWSRLISLVYIMLISHTPGYDVTEEISLFCSLPKNPI